MSLNTSRHNAMAISSLIKEEDQNNTSYYLPPVMSSSVSSTTSWGNDHYPPPSFACIPRSKSSSSMFDIPTTMGFGANTIVQSDSLLLESPNRPQSTDERRRRNKEASARYRAKRNQRNEDMRNVVAKLIHQNNVLFTALQEAYQHQGRDAPKSMDEVADLMTKARPQHQQYYTRSMSTSPCSYPSSSSLMDEACFSPSTTISSKY